MLCFYVVNTNDNDYNRRRVQDLRLKMYKDKDKQRETQRERQRRYRERQKALLEQGVTDKALPLNPMLTRLEIAKRVEREIGQHDFVKAKRGTDDEYFSQEARLSLLNDAKTLNRLLYFEAGGRGEGLRASISTCHSLKHS